MALQAESTPKPHAATGWWWGLGLVAAFILSAGGTWLFAGGWRMLTSRPTHGQTEPAAPYLAQLAWPVRVDLRLSPVDQGERGYRLSWGLLTPADGPNTGGVTVGVLPPLTATVGPEAPLWLLPGALTTAPLVSARRQYRPWLRPIVPLDDTFPRLSPHAWESAAVASQLYLAYRTQLAPERLPDRAVDLVPSLAISGNLTGLATYLGSWPPPVRGSLAFAPATSQLVALLPRTFTNGTATARRPNGSAQSGWQPGVEGGRPGSPGMSGAVPALAPAGPTGLGGGTSGSTLPAGSIAAGGGAGSSAVGSEAAAPPGTEPGLGAEQAGQTSGSSGETSSPSPTTPTGGRGRWQIPQASLAPLGGLVRPAAAYSPLPAATVRGAYATGYLAGSERMGALAQTLRQAGLDAVVIEIKDEYGGLSYDSRIPLARQIGASGSKIKDVRALLDNLHRQGMYVIARMVTFQDGKLAQARPEWAIHSRKGGLWRNQVGLAWVDPGLGPVWEYEVDVAEEALQLGFDEVQFDYVRFPTDGDVDNILSVVPANQRVQAISAFLEYARQRLAPYGRPVSADAFGFVATADSDLGIGQHLEEMSGPLDFVSLMVYPSHYPPHSYGFADPDLNPYGVVDYAMKRASQRVGAAKQRPWLQSFSLRHPYGPAQLLDQLRAVGENRITSWLLWNASGRYDQLKGLMFP